MRTTTAVARNESASSGALPSAKRGVLQHKCACGGTPGAAGECAECRRKRQLSRTLQTKLRVNRPGDRYEQEADRVAERVMCIAESHLQRHIDDKDVSELSLAKPLMRLQATDREGGGEVPPIVHEVLRSPGHPLDPATRAFMESRFGHDFGRVRVHSDARGAESAQAVNALAYAVGQDIVFGADQYAPHNDKGRSLLAHELAHTVQQRSTFANAKPPISEIPFVASHSTAELQANSVVEATLSVPNSPRATISLTRSGPVVARVDRSQFNYRTCKAGVYKCGYGLSGTCGWVGPSRGGCICVGQTRRPPSTSRVLEVLTILGLSLLLVATVIAALLDPEPASKLLLGGLTAAEATALLLLLGYTPEEVRNMGLDPDLADTI